MAIRRRNASTRPRKIAIGLAGALAVMLVGCQIVPRPSIPAPKLVPNASTSSNASGQQGGVEVAGATAANTPATTSIVKRTTLQSSLDLNGRVAPSRTAVLTLRGSGTVTGVDVSAGQGVSQGAPLVEFSLDDASLQTARMQATTAELAYESERDKLTTLKAGASSDSMDQQRAIIARDNADIQRIQQGQAAAAAGADNADVARAAAKDAADRKVAMAQVALSAAQDSLTAAQANAKHIQDETQSAQANAKDDATIAVTTAANSIKSAQRQVESATIKLNQAKMQWNTTKANQSVETLQLKMSQDNDALKAARATQDNATTGAQHAAADALKEAAQRTLTTDTLEMQHQQTNLEAAKQMDQDAVRVASLDLDAANESLAQAQTTQQQAQQRLDRISKPGASTASTGSGQNALPTDPDSAQAAVAQAQHAVETQKLQLQDAQASADAVANAPATQAADASGDLTLSAAQAQLKADQSKLDQLNAGASQTEVNAAQARVDALQQQAVAAAAAAKSVVQLTAPFDGTVAQVGVTVGQTIAPLAAGVDSSVAAASATAGQTPDGRPIAIRLVGNGGNSVVADVQESNVGQLQIGQTVDVSFPGVPGQPISGKVSDIASTANPKPTAGTPVTYPVQVDVPSMPDGVRVGMSADISVSRGDGTDVLTVPRTALRNNSGQTLVTVIDPNGQPHDAPVQVGRAVGSEIQVVSGVNEGDVIAVYEPPTVASQKQP
jgi:HlyD family secretion protein